MSRAKAVVRDERIAARCDALAGWEGVMHPVLFSVKRVHLTGLKKQRKITREMISDQLTPERLDILRLVYVFRHAGFAFQVRIANVFGVAKSSISRMLQKLERDGFIQRWKFDDDRRYKLVKLTDVGRYMMELFCGVQMRREPHADFEFAFLLSDNQPPDWTPIYRLFNRVRRALDDTAPFLHPWNRRDFYKLPDNPVFAATVRQLFEPTMIEENDVDDDIDDFEDPPWGTAAPALAT